MTEPIADCSWLIQHDGQAWLRDRGELAYRGPVEAMPEDVKKIAAEFTADWPEVSGAKVRAV